MKLFVETIPAFKPKATASSTGDVHLTLTGNGTFVGMTVEEARALADSLHAAASAAELREVA